MFVFVCMFVMFCLFICAFLYVCLYLYLSRTMTRTLGTGRSVHGLCLRTNSSRAHKRRFPKTTYKFPRQAAATICIDCCSFQLTLRLLLWSWALRSCCVSTTQCIEYVPCVHLSFPEWAHPVCDPLTNVFRKAPAPMAASFLLRTAPGCVSIHVRISGCQMVCL